MIVLFNSAANGSGGNAVPLSQKPGAGGLRIQTNFPPGTTGTITIQSRIDPTLPWVTVDTTTANKISQCEFCEYWQAVLSGVAGGGTVTVGLQQ